MNCRRWKREVKERRSRAFEAVFTDPDMDLEEVAAEVGHVTLLCEK